MQLTRLTIQNLRAIERLDLDLSDAAGAPRRRVVLLGANGSGKTTILDAVAHVYQSLGTADELGARLLGAGDVRSAKPAAGVLPAPPQHAIITIEAALSSDERHGIRTWVPDPPARGTVNLVVGGQLPAALREAGTSFSGFRDAARAALLSLGAPCVLLPASRGALDDDEAFPFQQVTTFAPRAGCLQKGRERFAPVAARLALAFIGGERTDPDGTVARMWKVLAKYFPEMPRPIDVRNLRLWFENGDGSIVPLSALSDGERAVLLLFAEIALRAPKDGLVMVDEVEQHLHPRWQRAVLEGLPALVPSAQFIFATQAPYVASCAPDDTIEVGDWKHHGE
jgi:hypothetical protein